MSEPTRTKIGVVSTIADARWNIDFFIQYHLSIGVSHIFLFIDDECSETYQIAISYNNVTPIHVNKFTKENWALTPIYHQKDRERLHSSEVMVRQELNLYLAQSLALNEGIDWLIHIDIDELFYLNNHNIQTFFKNLEASGKVSAIFKNYEAIPITAENTNIYLSTPYFKKNYFCKARWHYSKEQKSFIDSCSWLRPLYFNYYQNGKCASLINKNIHIDDVHSFRPTKSNINFMDEKSPLILHFPCTSIDEFKTKYRRLGNFSDIWRGYPRAGKFIDSLHLEARDCLKCSDPNIALEELFYKRILLSQPQIQELIQYDLATKITLPFQRKDIKTKTISFKEKRNNNHSTFKTEWKNSISAYHPCLNSIIYNENPELALCFESISEAKKWIRRHPFLKNKTNLQIKQDSFGFKVCEHGVYYVDFQDQRTHQTLINWIHSSENLDNTIFDLRRTYFRKYDPASEFQCISRRAKLKELINAHTKSYSEVYFVVDNATNILTFPRTAGNVIDLRSLGDIILGIKQQDSGKISNAINSNYPKPMITNSAILYSPEQKGLQYIRSHYDPIFYFLGGTIVNHPDKEENIYHAIREKYPAIINSYAKALNTENNLLVLRKKIENENFLLVANYNHTPQPIEKNVFLKNNLPKNWVCINQQHDINRILAPKQIIWLKSE
ncbi:glycosyltransferase family 2 protein [Teredinibacter sp. KSP-S5-2]|uniref:glycosyltransferase family 2 protein n=1 Tax=Teredinibacter sp. KSP-S5-2 TaxID=3034506 RepID=UPI002934B717|nr:glycosyltransferase family 2 protein [Teredinibacter sp. KSP-S5-2]WNO11326.1 glycosyltransferase family 2 protein [Teredinibacter sp. KSP-S5-2]